MALDIGDREVRPLTADEVLRMVDAGILGEDDRVELLGGVLTRVSPKGRAHEAVKERLIRWLAAGLADGRYAVRAESGLAVPDRTSLPEPDVAVFEAGHDELELPETALLVVEVAVTSLRTDTEVKPGLYAAAGVQEYWSDFSSHFMDTPIRP